jgi:hypothetical protein
MRRARSQQLRFAGQVGMSKGGEGRYREERVASFLQACSANHCLYAIWLDLGNGYLKQAKDKGQTFILYAVERQVGRMDSVRHRIGPLQLKTALGLYINPSPPILSR